MRAGRYVWPTLATAATGLLGWVTMVAVARSAGPSSFAGFAVAWALFFGVGGAFAGLQQEVTRTVSLAHRAEARVRLVGVVVLLAVPGCMLSAAVVGFGGVDVGALHASRPSMTLALVSGLVGLAVLTFLCGVLAARDAWFELALLLVADGSLRTAAVLGCLAARHQNLLPWAVGLGTFAWVPLLGLRRIRGAMRAVAADRLPVVLRKLTTAMGATVCAALLVAGFPFALSLMRPGQLGADAGTLLATLVLVRSPLLVVLYGFRPVIMRSFLAEGVDVRRTLARLWLMLLAAGVAAVALAALLGPGMVRLVFGHEYSSSTLDLTALAAGSVLVALLVVSGLALLAEDRHTASTAGWLVAVAVALVLIASAATDRQAILLGVALAPLAGLATHVVALLRDTGMASPHEVESRNDQISSSSSW